MADPSPQIERFVDDRTIRRVPSELAAAPRRRMTSAELYALQRRFDRFIEKLNPSRERRFSR